jgi:hypothetical protein
MNAFHAAVFAFGAALTCIWLITLTAMRTRAPSAEVHPQPPTLEFCPEPPAVAATLVHQSLERKGRAGNEAVAATLMDLAARGVVGLEQVGQQLTVRLCPRPAGLSLTPYERRVQGHVGFLSRNDVLPAQALGDVEDGPQLGLQEFGNEVAAEARARGLTTKRWRSGAMAWMCLLAAWAGATLGVGLARPPGVADDLTWLFVGAANGAWIGALIFYSVMGSDRLTADGAVAAGHWLGVRAQMAADRSVADLPPTAVAQYGRYLSYAAALGVARAAVAALPIGRAADTKTALTPDRGDEWRSVEITYPRGPDYGSNPASLIWRRLFGVAALGFWAFVLIVAVPWILSGSGRPLGIAALAVSVLVGVGLALLGGRTLVRALQAAADLGATETVEGVVVRKYSSGSDEGSSPDYWIAVDDRSGPAVAAWKVRLGIYQQVSERDLIRASVTRRYKYVNRVQVLAADGGPGN